MRWRWSFCCSAMLASVLPTVVTAQGPPVAGTHGFTHLQAAVAGRRVLAVHSDGRQEELSGVALYRTGELRHPNDSSGLPINSLQAIKVRKSGAGRGARIGAVVGGLSFLALGVAMAQDDLLQASGGAAVMITVIGMSGGAVTGALLGAPFSYWKTVYRAPSAVRPTLGFRDGGFRLGAQVSF